MKTKKFNFIRTLEETIFRSIPEIILLIFIIYDKETLKILIEILNKLLTGNIGKLNVILILIPIIIIIELTINIGCHVVYNRDIKKED